MPFEQIANAVQGTDVARLNLLTNGGFEIWQRGNGPYTANGVYSADRWSVLIGGGSGTVSVTRIASTVGRTGYSSQAVYTHAAGTFAGIVQRVENFAAVANLTVTFAVTVKSSVAGAVLLQLDDGTGLVNSAVNVGTGVERLTVTKLISGIASKLDAVVYFHLASANATVEVNDAMLVVGSIRPMSWLVASGISNAGVLRITRTWGWGRRMARHRLSCNCPCLQLWEGLRL